jgi:hypothetical protein
MITGLATTYSLGFTSGAGFSLQPRPLFTFGHLGRFGILHNDQPFADTHLGRGQTHARRGAHGLDHVIDQDLQALVERRDRPRLSAQDRIGQGDDLTKSHG